MNLNIQNKIGDTLRIKRVHLRKTNSSRRERSGHTWVTITQILNKATGELVAIGKSYCSSHDNPSRKIGRAIADGRALKELHDIQSVA